ncbi:hypothetical protein ACYATP_04695 [Lactobacillaceae bacterium Melli_B4]
MENPQLFNLFRDYYIENEKLMSDFQDDDDITALNESMEKLNDKFVEDYFVQTGERIHSDQIADVVATVLTGDSDLDDDSSDDE